MQDSRAGGCSAAVRLFVCLNGQQIPLTQIGGGRMYFDTPTSLPAGPAEVIIEIDGEPRSTAVVIAECTGAATSVRYSVA
jgi:hypothetical protein